MEKPALMVWAPLSTTRVWDPSVLRACLLGRGAITVGEWEVDAFKRVYDAGQ